LFIIVSKTNHKKIVLPTSVKIESLFHLNLKKINRNKTLRNKYWRLLEAIDLNNLSKPIDICFHALPALRGVAITTLKGAAITTLRCRAIATVT